MQDNTMQYNTIQYYAIQYNRAEHDTTEHNRTQQNVLTVLMIDLRTKACSTACSISFRVTTP